ncbi:aminotransferase class I/II-fold pyridoxal phosphate-dependent enzyme [Anoxynatronum buryatiense]|uniref:Aspartate/methionine/tyrosine aminotransferase n=1 Tax=Anoxynatronum buryatiense TaxID=489973 RepID=A0AA46AHT0_9CLOT|nr:aminotransferase class I/II-fold pyridoxal phosphate-dependent enzyme [Anoxynatronum buryatiense]SMP43086.1 Aspartate/methionine/tyrosine aminotransferase [Anoxynatronum buryatiense]
MKHKFIAKKYWKDQTTPMGEVDDLVKLYSNVINLSLGDPDQTTDEGVIQFALQEALQGHTHYTDFRGDPELRQEIRNFYRDDFKTLVDDPEIMVTASACLAVYLVLEATLDPGDEVILPAPYFTPYYQQVELAGGIPVELPTYEEENFQVDLKRLEAAITDRTRAIIVNSPTNPTGAVFSEETLQLIGDIAIKRDLLIIADEVYQAFVFNGDFQSLITIDDIRDRLVVVNTFSKDYQMTGWRVGHMIAPREIIRICQQINENVVFTPSSVSQRAALYALRNRHTLLAQSHELYRERVGYAARRIQQIPWMSVLEPQGTFYLFVNIKKTGLSSQEVSKMILHQARVLTIPGNSFGTSGEGYLRIACTVSQEKLKEAFDRIEKIQLPEN